MQQQRFADALERTAASFPIRVVDAWAWGGNGSGQLGNNSTERSLVPVAVQMPTNVTFTAISVGYDHSVALSGSAGQIDRCRSENAHLSQKERSVIADAGVYLKAYRTCGGGRASPTGRCHAGAPDCGTRRR